ncbi:MAG TPA: 6-phosphogluconolactonase, partial [Chloroflexota bacterium]|nr:6-phosphogluconolactonase [Chloroflexota bacterium]
GTFSIALSGGSTPRTLYELLATPEIAAEAPWEHMQIFWGDERHVPPDHPESNYRMAREALLDHVPIPQQNIHRIPAELPNPETVAVAYEDTLRRAFRLDPGERPRFDLILLGLGDDGHTASLFPHSPALHEQQRLVVANPVPKLATTRITLTVPVINNAERVWFLIAGSSKAHVLKNVLEGPRDPETYPAQLIDPTDGELILLLDTTAAAEISAGVRQGAVAGLG